MEKLREPRAEAAPTSNMGGHAWLISRSTLRLAQDRLLRGNLLHASRGEPTETRPTALRLTELDEDMLVVAEDLLEGVLLEDEHTAVHLDVVGQGQRGAAQHQKSQRRLHCSVACLFLTVRPKILRGRQKKELIVVSFFIWFKKNGGKLRYDET